MSFHRMVVLLAIVFAAFAARAESLTARQIVDRSLERNAFGLENSRAMLEMTLISKRGSERTRSLDIMSHEASDGKSRTLVRFLTPADVAGTTFLVVERQGDDDQYLYLPALGKTKRIAGSQRRQRFMGLPNGLQSTIQWV